MTAVSKKRGACIACVIGGKLSEGINFNDDLARAVIIIGLPYPNVYSAFVSSILSIRGNIPPICAQNNPVY